MANTKTLNKTKTDITYPNRYRVILFNDDYTPMEFVIKMLIEIFNKDIDTATEITMEIHTKGKGIAGIFTMEIAEQKVSEALISINYHGYNLKISAEPI